MIAAALCGLCCLLPETVSSQSQSLTTWPRFRGERSDGHVAAFPNGPWRPRLLWETPLPTQGVGGVAATHDFVVASSRSADDQQDLFVCLDPVTGAILWQLAYAAPGQLDYGNSPRATPVIADPYVFLLGAMGHVHCVDLDSGEVKWHKHLVQHLGGNLPSWGYSGSPLLVGNRLIVAPGGASASIAALDAQSGDVLWRTPGQPTAYASPVLADWFGRQQIVTYDRNSLGGWDLSSGTRLWTIQPPKPHDFNVPTPIVLPDQLLVVTENNGLRQYRVDPETGLPRISPSAQSDSVASDSHTPVVLGRTLIAADRELLAFDLDQRLAILWRIKDRAYRGHNSLIAAGTQVLVMTQGGELQLVETHAGKGEIIARHKIPSGARYVLAHPALVNDVLYVRCENSLQAWALW